VKSKTPTAKIGIKSAQPHPKIAFSGNSQKSRIEPNKAAPTIKNGINLIINLPTSFYYLPC
jgi:hypothetical protein